MKRTVNLDNDVLDLVRREMLRSGRSLEQVINAAVRSVLSQEAGGADEAALISGASNLGLRDEYEGANCNTLVDELEAEATAQRLPSAMRRPQ